MAVWRGGRWGRSVCSRHSQRRGGRLGEGKSVLFIISFAAVVAVCLFFFGKLFFIYLGGEERERTRSRCVGVALKVVPMAHAATLTHGCTPAVPGGTVTYFS